jgi:HEAT repeat protein
MRAPVDEIDELTRVREGWSDAAVLADLIALEPLPGEDGFYADRALSSAAWARANLFVALGGVCAARRLRPAAKLLLERASDGDPGEMMRGLRHSLEAIFNPDWGDLARVCVECLRSERAGTRMWAANELGILREPMGLPGLIAALDDPQAYDPLRDTVLGHVTMAIAMLCRAHPRLAPDAIAALRARAPREPEGSLFERTARKIALGAQAG